MRTRDRKREAKRRKKNGDVKQKIIDHHVPCIEKGLGVREVYLSDEVNGGEHDKGLHGEECTTQESE